jgi:hypothetical protein
MLLMLRGGVNRKVSALEKDIAQETPKSARMSIGIDDARRLHAEILRYRRENLRQAQRALEIAKLLELIIEPRGRE